MIWILRRVYNVKTGRYDDLLIILSSGHSVILGLGIEAHFWSSFRDRFGSSRHWNRLVWTSSRFSSGYCREVSSGYCRRVSESTSYLGIGIILSRHRASSRLAGWSASCLGIDISSRHRHLVSPSASCLGIGIVPWNRHLGIVIGIILSRNWHLVSELASRLASVSRHGIGICILASWHRHHLISSKLTRHFRTDYCRRVSESKHPDIRSEFHTLLQ